MKLILSLIIGIIFIQSVFGCTQDYQCGSQHSICRNRLHLFPGLALMENGDVMVMGKFNNSANQPVGKTYLASIPSSGGGVTPLYPIRSDVPNYPNYTQAFELIDNIKNGNIPYINAYQIAFPSVGPYYDSTGVFTPVWTVARYVLGLYFDQVESRTYYCDVGVHRINKIANTKQDKDSSLLLYKDQRCNFITVVGNDIYLLVNEFNLNTTHSIYKGSISCTNCEASNLIKITTFPGSSSGFVSHGNTFYISSTNEYTNIPGIYSVSLINPSSRTWLTSDSVGDLVIDSLGKYIYYQTYEGYQYRPMIKKLDLSGKLIAPVVLYDEGSAGNSQGVCGCIDGFSGVNCQCVGGNIQWNEAGVPSCIKTLPSGQPESCTNGWQCINYPFTQCYGGACVCSEGFKGDKCDQCSGTVTWDNNIPYCK